MLDSIKYYLYGKHFVLKASLGKMVAVGSLIEAVVVQYFHWTNAIVILVGLIYDVFMNRPLLWYGRVENDNCPICLDGELENETINGETGVDEHGKTVDIEPFDVLKCKNCESELVEKEKPQEEGD